MAEISRMTPRVPIGCFAPIALAAMLTIPGCLAPKAAEWNPRPAMLEHAFKVHPKLDAMDMIWSGPELLADTGLETWVMESPYLHGWLTTSWTVDPEEQTVQMDWSKLEELKR